MTWKLDMITLHRKTYVLRQVSDTAAFNTDECAGCAFNLPVNSMADLELCREANKLSPCDPSGEWDKVYVEMKDGS